MNIPKSYEALAADLASEKILSKTLLSQKEAYMMLADKGGLDLSESKAREAALREEIEMAKQVQEATDAIVTMVDGQRDHWIEKCGLLKQRLTVAERRESEAREELLDLSRKLDVFYSRSHGIKNLSAIEDANDKSKALQQRLTVAEQLLSRALQYGGMTPDWRDSVEEALKTDADCERGHSNQTGCPVCQGIKP